MSTDSTRNTSFVSYRIQEKSPTNVVLYLKCSRGYETGFSYGGTEFAKADAEKIIKRVKCSGCQIGVHYS